MLHFGHEKILKRAKSLGDYLIVGVTGENYDRSRGKLNVQQSLHTRIKNVEKTGLADEILVEEYDGQKLLDIQSKNIDIFAIGSDWKGKYDFLSEYCKVIYLPRTRGISSTILRNKNFLTRIGIIGTGNIANRFAQESNHVSNSEVTAVLSRNSKNAESFAKTHSIELATNNFDLFINNIDAAYIATPHDSHYFYSKLCLKAGKHVLCEKPITLSKKECKELWDIAKNSDLLLLEGIKTAFCEGFQKMISFSKSGIIGNVIQLDANFTKLISNIKSREFLKNGGSHNELMSYMLLASVKILGHKVVNYNNTRFYDNSEVDIFSNLRLEYENSIANLSCGIGAKKEGDLTITGTKGFIYCPAPWWKTKQINIKFENSEKNETLNFPFKEDGLRYEIAEFVNLISSKNTRSFNLTREESIFINNYINCSYTKLKV